MFCKYVLFLADVNVNSSYYMQFHTFVIVMCVCFTVKNDSHILLLIAIVTVLGVSILTAKISIYIQLFYPTSQKTGHSVLLTSPILKSRAGSGIVRIDPLHFLTGCCKR